MPVVDEVNAGQHIVDAAVAAGVRTCFTLSGAHVFPIYDAAVGGKDRVLASADPRTAERDGPLRLVDTRHEQTAVFAAEATGRLTRTPGFAAVTAGPGVTNAVSAVATASFNGTPMVVVGGRSPDSRWGQGALQELDHVPLLSPITKAAWTTHSASEVRSAADRAFALAASARSGPVFWDVPIDVIFAPSAREPRPAARPIPAPPPDDDAVAAARRQLDAARHPLVVLGSGVWQSDAVDAARELVRLRDLPVVANGMARGVLGPSDPHLVTRARSRAFAEADLVVVVGTPLDFRLGYGAFGDPAAPVIHLVQTPDEVSASPHVACSVVGGLTAALLALGPGRAVDGTWTSELRQAALAAIAADEPMLTSRSTPIHPARIYGELRSRLTPDSIVIGDGGDFVSFAGRFVEPEQPGRWLDPGPYGCLGTGPGFALAAGIVHPSSPLFLLMGDGAAGFSLADLDTLARHRVPAVVIVGNNAGWGLEKGPMRLLYGYDVVADLSPTRYDEAAIALGCGGECVTDPEQVGPAIDRAMTAGIPYVVNVMTDPDAAYPRSTLGI